MNQPNQCTFQLTMMVSHASLFIVHQNEAPVQCYTHELRSFRHAPYYQKMRKSAEKEGSTEIKASEESIRNRCKICTNKTPFYCFNCSKDPTNTEDPGFYAVCSAIYKPGSNCYNDHLRLSFNKSGST